MKYPIILFMVFFAVLPLTVAAAPKAELWDVWTPYDQSSVVRVDHSSWERFLGRYLVTGQPSGVNLFAYAAVSAEDRAVLRSYAGELERVVVDELNRPEQMAYWINLYNALTIELVLDHWPADSIRDINLGGGGLFSRGPWDAPLAEVQGRKVTLNDIEHRILRPIWEDPRIHYAVNCASIGCPNLQPEAFTGGNLERLLETAAVAYVNDPRGVEVDGNVLRLSSIYDWFSEDFGDSREEILRHVSQYADSGLQTALERFRRGEGRIRYRYDWSVNAAE